MIKVGDIVKYRERMDPGDDVARYVVVEVDRERAKIKFIGEQHGDQFIATNLPLPPWYSVGVNAITEADS